MSAKKIEINFNEYFPWLWNEAKRQGFNKGEWMTKSGLDPQRWAEFARGCGISEPDDNLKSRDVSAYYFISLAGGVSLASSQVEKKSGIRFSDEQREQLQIQAWVRANEDLVKVLMKDGERLKICKDVCRIK